jgi:5-epimerase
MRLIPTGQGKVITPAPDHLGWGSVQFRELAVPGAIEFTPKVFPDARGLFVAPFQEPLFLDATGHRLHLAQSNHSVSGRGVIRGVHFADVPPGQAKYVYCPQGALLDVVIDLRVGSPAFGRWDAVRLDAGSYRAVYLPEGLGHAFVALAEDTVMAYLCSTGYNPAAEHGVHPLDPALGLPWSADLDPVVSDKDGAAPTLAEAEATGILPRWADCQARYDALRAAG